jgi:WD40 repeat protein
MSNENRKLGSKFKWLEAPIYAINTINSYLLIACGGGGKKYGVRNYIYSYKINKDGFSEEPIYSIEYPTEIPLWISTYEVKEYNFFAVCMDNKTLFYKMDIQSGSFKEMYQLITMSFYNADQIYQSVCSFDLLGKRFATGTSDGILKLWNVTINQNTNLIENIKVFKETQAHVKSINEILIIDQLGYLITASSDGFCKIYELASMRFIKKICFRVDQGEKNHIMRGCRYDRYNNYLYTLQTPTSTKDEVSYVTKWDIGSGFEPLNTIKINGLTGLCIDFSPYDKIIGIGAGQGSLVYIDPSSIMKITKKLRISENTIKSVSFRDSHLFSGIADNSFQMNSIYKSGYGSIRSFFKLSFFLLLCFYLYEKVIIIKK